MRQSCQYVSGIEYFFFIFCRLNDIPKQQKRLMMKGFKKPSFVTWFVVIPWRIQVPNGTWKAIRQEYMSERHPQSCSLNDIVYLMFTKSLGLGI